jgi:hypothetical protein
MEQNPDKKWGYYCKKHLLLEGVLDDYVRMAPEKFVEAYEAAKGKCYCCGTAVGKILGDGRTMDVGKFLTKEGGISVREDTLVLLCKKCYGRTRPTKNSLTPAALKAGVKDGRIIPSLVHNNSKQDIWYTRTNVYLHRNGIRLGDISPEDVVGVGESRPCYACGEVEVQASVRPDDGKETAVLTTKDGSAVLNHETAVLVCKRCNHRGSRRFANPLTPLDIKQRRSQFS